MIYERALKCLPRSYKLWQAYLRERSSNLADKCITSKRFEILINTFERALIHMNKMPRIWSVSYNQGIYVYFLMPSSPTTVDLGWITVKF